MRVIIIDFLTSEIEDDSFNNNEARGHDGMYTQYSDDDVVPMGNDDDGDGEDEVQYTQDLLEGYNTQLERSDRAVNVGDFDMGDGSARPPPPPPPPSPVTGLNRSLFNHPGTTTSQCHGAPSTTKVSTPQTNSDAKQGIKQAEGQQDVIMWNSSVSQLLKHANSIRVLEDGTRVCPYGPILRLSDGCHLGFTKKVPPKTARSRKIWHNLRFGRAYAPDSETGEYTKIFFFDLTCPGAKVLFSNQPELLRIIEEVTKQPDPPSSWVSSEELIKVG